MGTVFDISRTSINDGPGIRTTVFLKGCPLRCKWCHNPESYAMRPQLFFFKEKCLQCRCCQAVCKTVCHSFPCYGAGNNHEIAFQSCTACGGCVKACPYEALTVKGMEMTAEDVIETVKRDKGYYMATGGGMTISGGEPLLQWEFTLELLNLARSNDIHTCVETSGFGSRDKFIKVVSATDMILFDCKGIDDVRHIQNTGVSNKTILKNLKLLDKMKKPVVLRCPLIPGLNDNDEDLMMLTALANSIRCISHCEIMPYHNMGAHKQMRFSNDKLLIDKPSATEDDKTRWRESLEKIIQKQLIIN